MAHLTGGHIKFTDQLKGTTIDEGARLNLRNEFDKLIEKQS